MTLLTIFVTALWEREMLPAKTCVRGEKAYAVRTPQIARCTGHRQLRISCCSL